MSASTTNPVLRQNQDVLQDVHQHQTTEFLGDLRCAACIEGNKKCRIREWDSQCFLCEYLERQCIFTRTVLKTGSRHDMTWDDMIGLATPTQQRSIGRYVQK